MWRYLVGAVAAMLLVGAGVVLFGHGREEVRPLLPAAPGVGAANSANPDPLPSAAPEATERTREQKRFDRYDKDRDGKVTRDEYLAQRRKAFAKLDTNGDGRLSFDEWAIKSTTRFADADKDRSGSMTPAEFATTAPKRRARSPRACPPTTASADGADS